MSRLDKLIELGGKTFASVEDFIKAIEEIWKGEKIEIGFVLAMKKMGDFVGLNIDTEEGEYIARYDSADDGKVTFVALEEVE